MWLYELPFIFLLNIKLLPDLVVKLVVFVPPRHAFNKADITFILDSNLSLLVESMPQFILVSLPVKGVSDLKVVLAAQILRKEMVKAQLTKS